MYYQPERLTQIEPEFLEFEEDMVEITDLELIVKLLVKDSKQVENPYNSCILYVSGLTDQFDFVEARCKSKGGSSPDLDIDHSAAGRDKAIELVVQNWGRDRVANIMTRGTFQPRSLTQSFYRITMPDDLEEQKKHIQERREVLDLIPKPLFGKEPSLKEIKDGNPDKGYPANPDIDKKYPAWWNFASALEDMTANTGIHASGVVISDEPIYNVVPMWSNSKSERITQFDMSEVEALGYCKFDFLSINNLDIIQECVTLIKERHGKEYDIYSIPDGDPKAYALLSHGLLGGIFQFETSRTAKELITQAQPVNIEEISDISALNRPGPISAGFTKTYLENKRLGYAPHNMPKPIANILAKTYWTLLYQETVMLMCKELAGFNLLEADSCRKALGKKDKKHLLPYEAKWKQGFLNSGLTMSDAEEWWNVLLGCADYLYNLSHSISYSTITYLCAYFKANYPVEFFCALMTVRSQGKQPALWAEKAPEYIQEAQALGVKIHPPSVQQSENGFTIVNNEIYFGLSGIRSVGLGAANAIIKARGNTKFKDIWDFIARTGSKVNSKTIEALAIAGAFDSMGYKRSEILENLDKIVAYLPSLQEYETHLVAQRERARVNQEIDILREEMDTKIKEAKKLIKDNAKLKIESSQDTHMWANLKETLKEVGEALANGLVVDPKLKDLHEKYGQLRKLPNLKDKDYPTAPSLSRNHTLSVSVNELMDQANYIGCYLGLHPVRVVFPDTVTIGSVEEDDFVDVAGQVISLKEITTRRGDPMAVLQVSDGTATAELVLFPQLYRKFKSSMPAINDLLWVSGRVETIEPVIKLIPNKMKVHRREIENT